MPVTPFGPSEADELRRSVGVFVRAIRDATGDRTVGLDQAADRSDGEIETLGFLMRGGAMSIAALARSRSVRHQSMSAVVSELAARGLVERSADPSDARGVLIALTSAGSGVVTESRESRSAIIRTAADDALSADDLAVLARVPAILDALSVALSPGRT